MFLLKLHSRLIILAILFFATLFITSSVVAAPCKDITDLDDKAACLQKEIEEREEEYESTSKKLSDIKSQKESVSSTISKLSQELHITQTEIDDLQASITQMEKTLEEIKQNLENRRESLSDKINLRNTVVKHYYQNGILNNLEIFLSSSLPGGLNGFQYATRAYSFEKTLGSETIKIIGALNSEIKAFESDKKEAEEIKVDLEESKKEIVALKIQLDSQKNEAQSKFGDLEGKENNYESELKSLAEEIDSLTKKQQEIIAAKSGEGNGTVGNYDSPTWSVPDPPFSPAFAAFSYGAYTHYRGMSQYGASARAEDGQSYEDIIKFYYKNDVKEDDDLPDEISVEGYGDLDFQYYLYGLAEMPSDWPEEALKAQAVAGRTYAYRYVKAGKTICTSQSCQVFLKSKADNPPERWKKAVDETENEIISGDSHAMYSSTTGGYIDDGVGWDDDGSWPGDAYEKKAKSPWFYWAWYSQNYRFDSSTCGRSHPWLDDEEMADILNSIVVWDKGNGDDKDKISPVTTNCWGGDPYSVDDMRERAGELDKSFSKVTGVSTSIGSNGRTSQVSFTTDNGSFSVDGEKFKTVFNLRAPGYISIRSRLYDIKKE